MDEEKLSAAKAVYESICEMLDARKWIYTKEEDNLKIHTQSIGEDLLMNLDVTVIPEMEIVSMISNLPYIIKEDKIVPVAKAVCLVNDCLVDGCFDFNPLKRIILFRITTSFRQSLIGADAFDYLIKTAFTTIDDYNEHFLNISLGNETYEDFAASLDK